MTTARPSLKATPRTIIGKHVARLRRAGQLPAVVYGRGEESTNVQVDTHEFEQLRRFAGPNTLVDLSIDGGKARPILVQEVQLNHVTGRMLHADLYLVRMTDELTVDVPLVPTGKSEAIETLGGTLLHVTENVRIKALPDHLPQSITYDLAPLETFEDAIHVRDLAIPDDVTLLTDLDEIVAKVAPPRVEEEPVVAEVPEGEEGEEGAEAAEEGAVEGEGARVGEAGRGSESEDEG
ncbi:MAG: 50S ribosomal protein L25 [Chloroflexi bacterium]|nr:50S ribosomal protein L25 [Chloroflexota bacterium]